jgi:hypothetical protein
LCLSFCASTSARSARTHWLDFGYDFGFCFLFHPSPLWRFLSVVFIDVLGSDSGCSGRYNLSGFTCCLFLRGSLFGHRLYLKVRYLYLSYPYLIFTSPSSIEIYFGNYNQTLSRRHQDTSYYLVEYANLLKQPPYKSGRVYIYY